MRAIPFSSASAEFSSTSTGIPASAKHMAMPPPIVPAPITAALRSFRAVTVLSISGTLPASRSVRARGIARHHHLERRLEPDEARQALDAAGARHDADLDFGKAYLTARRADAEMAAERHLETAAEGDAVDRCDHRLRARLDG